MDVDIDELRKDTSGIERLGMEEILDSYDAIIRELERPPIIMGHSKSLGSRGLRTASSC
jgi:hypothetical protein